MPRIRKVRVLAVALPTALLIAAGTAWADPVLAESMGLDVWRIGQLEDELQAHGRRAGRLESELADLQERMQVNESLFAELLAGRIDLVSAARQKWDANKDRKVIREHLDDCRCGATYEAKTAHDLYLRFEWEGGLRPLDPAVGRRLKAEFEAAYGPLPKGVNF